jgi:hypothetical protein
MPRRSEIFSQRRDTVPDCRPAEHGVRPVDVCHEPSERADPWGANSGAGTSACGYSSCTSFLTPARLAIMPT